MAKKFLLIFCAIFLLIGSAKTQAQNKNVSGVVTSSEDGVELPGVSVKVKGSTRGTSTDANGKYTISVSADETLVFSYIGMQSVELKVGNQSTINVKLKSDASQLNEVVVTAFGVEKEKRTLGYATQTVSGDDVNETQRENFLNALQGRVAGATINATSGAPGASSQIVLRGFNSLSGNNSPLIVVDGLPIDNQTLDQNNLTVQGSNRQNDFTNRAADINPNDIESITVLKGPEAAALYGIQAGSGAIVITTKKGKAGKMKISYDNNFRVDQTYLFTDVQDVFGIGFLGDSTQTRRAFGPRLASGVQTFDNTRNFFQDALTQRHNLSLSGGVKNVTYRFSGSTINQQGTIPTTGFDRYNGRLTLGYKTKNNMFDVTGTGAYTYSYNQKALRGAGGFLQALVSWPITSDARDYLNEDGTRKRFFDNENFQESDNPYWLVNQNESSDETNRFNYNLAANFRPTKWLTLSAKGSYDGYKTTGDTFFDPRSNQFFSVGGQIENYTVDYRGFSGVFLATATKTVGKFDNRLMVGSAIDDWRTETFSERGQNLQVVNDEFVNDFSTIDPATYLNSRTLGRDTLSLRRLVGVFAEYTVSYDRWLNLTVAGRNDVTSTLPKASRSFFYPSASLSFVFSDLLGINPKLLTLGKLRASVAETAKDISPYGSQSVYNLQLTSGLGYGYGFTNNNPNIVPERQRTFELGTELKFLDNRLGVDFTYYNTLNVGQIVRLVRLSYGTGFILSTLNVADTRNQGMELMLTAQPIKTRNFVWNVNVNAAGTRNEVLGLPSNIPEYYNSDTWVDAFRNGLTLGSTTTSLTGQDYLRNDANQVLIDPNTGFPLVNPVYVPIAERNPRITGGILNSFSYKKLTFGFNLDYRIGGDIMNGTEYWNTREGYSTRTLDREQTIIVPGILRDGLENSATPTTNTMQIIPSTSSYFQDGRVYASNFVERDINWLRLREIRISYTLPTAFVQRVKSISSVSVYASGTDLFILSNYSGADPSANSNNAATAGIGGFGIDYFTASTPRGFNAGVRLDLGGR
jgi:TonB-linked SusC/RagA family outer membrane protein